MAILPKTVGELRKALEMYPDDLEIWVQADTTGHPNATPEHFVVEYYPHPDSTPPMLLLAGMPFSLEDQVADVLGATGKVIGVEASFEVLKQYIDARIQEAMINHVSHSEFHQREPKQ